MRTTAGLRRRLAQPDAGVAMVVTILVIAVLTGLGASAAVLAISDQQNATRDRQGAGAQNISEGGLAQGIAYIRGGGIPTLTCTVNPDYSVAVNPSAAGCTSSNPWSNPTTPFHYDAGSGQSYDVWIGILSPFSPPTTRSGTYRIYSSGTSGSSPGKRVVFEDVQVAPLSFPVGIFSNSVNLGGTGGILNESLYSTGCIDSRGAILFQGTDSFYGVPTAAHTTSSVTTSNGKCSQAFSIHSSGACNALYPYDQDAYGGSLAGTPCAAAAGQVFSTSAFTLADLKATYGYTDRGLTAAQYATLKGVAQSQHHYYDASSPDPSFYWPCWTTAALCPSGHVPELKPTIYVKDPGNTNPPTNFSGYQWVQNLACTAVQPSIVMVDESGSLTLNGGQLVTGNVFVPDSTMTMQGGASLWGSIFTNNLIVTGGGTIQMPPCFVQQFNPSVSEVTPIRFHEDDR